VERFTLAMEFKKEWSDDDASVILLQFKFQELLEVLVFCSKNNLVVDHNCSINSAFVQVISKLSFCLLLSKVSSNYIRCFTKHRQ